ncbi:MAG: imidazole glycerol phosphate synthase subunit HisH [Thermoleophilia bacterium]|nr:imidazole glycerol phosphate synthase subunit HisH [Thermoleophilia bacterium]MDH3724148.1 imidazole glycerol phosphate synthase subunit HisH [Thermoleophilia bacterium]
MSEVVVLDYEMSNLRSAVKALERLGARVRVVRSGDELGVPAAVVLPGVGHFGEAMRRIRAAGFDDAVHRAHQDGSTVLGICLGLQLLFDESEESPGQSGLGLIRGDVRALRTDRKLPQIGWNTVEWNDWATIAAGADSPHDRTYYFVHSFAVHPADPVAVLGTAEYGERFCAAAGAERVTGVQFHPEKSSTAGLGLLRRWLTELEVAAAA